MSKLSWLKDAHFKLPKAFAPESLGLQYADGRRMLSRIGFSNSNPQLSRDALKVYGLPKLTLRRGPALAVTTQRPSLGQSGVRHDLAAHEIALFAALGLGQEIAPICVNTSVVDREHGLHHRRRRPLARNPFAMVPPCVTRDGT